MHELAVTESILNIVLKNAKASQAKKVVSVGLRIGEMTDLQDEWVQRYFDYLSKSTIAEGAALKIERSPVVFRCHDCGEPFKVNIHEIKDFACPKCGGEKVSFVSGREFIIKDLEVL
jgi:hydrogenase nickel incorporation protein HypA/HybF